MTSLLSDLVPTSDTRALHRVLSPAVIAERLRSLAMAADARERLRQHEPEARAVVPRVLDDLGPRLERLSAPGVSPHGGSLCAGLREGLVEHVAALFSAPLDDAFAHRCARLGAAFHAEGIPPECFTGAWAHLLCALLPVVGRAADDDDGGLTGIVALVKTAFLGVSFVLDGYDVLARASLRAQRIAGGPSAQPSATFQDCLVCQLSRRPPRVADPATTDAAAERRAFLGIGDEALAVLRANAGAVVQSIPALVVDLERSLSAWDEPRPPHDTQILDRLCRDARADWSDLTRSTFDRTHAAARSFAGVLHARDGITSDRYLLALARQLTVVLRGALPTAVAPLTLADALVRAVFFDLSFVLQAHANARAEVAQREPTQADAASSFPPPAAGSSAPPASLDASDGALGHVVTAVRTLMWRSTDDFALTLVSHSSLEVTGYRDTELIAKPRGMTSLIPEVDRTAFIKGCRELAVGEKIELHHRLNRADGVAVWVRSEVGRVATAEGQSVLCGVTVDVTASHLAEQRKLEAIGQLAGGIAHEYNNRLAVILASLSLLDESSLSTEQSELVREARASADRCAGLTRQILSVAQRQFLRPRPVVLNEVLGSAQPSIVRSLGSAVRFELRLAPDLWRCNVDVKELESAVIKLISNACESMPTGGRLTLSTRNVSAAETLAGGAAGRDHVELAVTDTGVGMDESVRRRAFEPFFTTKGAATGLGLSIVHGFVAQSGGRVHLDSEAGGGTVVRMLFPRAIERRRARSVPPTTERPLVLAVDDEPSLRFILDRLLKRLGYRVLTVGTTAEALDVLRTRRVDVLVTDVALEHGESGASLAPAARALKPELPVIYISGFTREELKLEALGPNDWFLAKPFTNEEMGEALREALVDVASARRGA